MELKKQTKQNNKKLDFTGEGSMLVNISCPCRGYVPYNSHLIKLNNFNANYSGFDLWNWTKQVTYFKLFKLECNLIIIAHFLNIWLVDILVKDTVQRV